MVPAVAIAAIGAVLIGLGSAIGVVIPHTSPVFTSWPVLLGIAAIPPVAAFASRARPRLASALLLAPAAFAPGRILLDAQLASEPERAARPELLVPTDLTALRPSLGLWLLLVGHLVTAIAGIVALWERHTEQATAAFADNVPAVRHRGVLVAVLGVAIVGAVGMLQVQFRSDDPFLLPRAALDSPLFVFAGYGALAIAVPWVAGYAAASADPAFARGGLLGLAVAIAGVVLPPLLAASVVGWLHYGWGAVLALFAALLLAGLAWPSGRWPDPQAIVPRLPEQNRIVALTGGLACAAGALAFVAAMTPQLEMAGLGRDPSVYPTRMLWPAGAIVVLLGVGVLLPRLGIRVRPALSVAWTVVPLAGAAVLDTVFAATQAAGLAWMRGQIPLESGPHPVVGAWLTGAALVLALLAAVASVFAGGVERDDVDLTGVTVRRAIMVPASLAGLLGVGAFSLPTVTAPGYTSPGLFTGFSTVSWGLLIGLFAVLGAVVIAPRARPERAVALLCGAALVLVQRCLELPLTITRIEGSAPGPGLWAGLLGVLASLLAIGMAARSMAESTEESAPHHST